MSHLWQPGSSGEVGFERKDHQQPLLATTCGKVSCLIIIITMIMILIIILILILIIILIMILIIIYRDSNYHAPSPLERVYSIREVATAAGRDNKF